MSKRKREQETKCYRCHREVKTQSEKEFSKAAAKRAFTLELVKAIAGGASACDTCDWANDWVIRRAQSLADACEKEGLL